MSPRRRPFRPSCLRSCHTSGHRPARSAAIQLWIEPQDGIDRCDADVGSSAGPGAAEPALDPMWRGPYESLDANSCCPVRRSVPASGPAWGPSAGGTSTGMPVLDLPIHGGAVSRADGAELSGPKDGACDSRYGHHLIDDGGGSACSRPIRFVDLDQAAML
jgi:hypothetical protein